MNQISSESQKLTTSALIDLFVLDLSKQSGPIHYFHAGTNELNNDVVWQGRTYVRYPLSVSGFDKRQNGALPRPIIQLSNIQGLLAAEARLYGYFLGCKLTRKRTHARFLDAVNFAAGNPNADPNSYYPDEIWYIDRKSNETPSLLEFEMSSSLELQGVGLPRRQFIQNVCTWVYKSTECGYTGGPVATAADVATSTPALDQCSKKLSGCKLRYPAPSTLPFGGFPACGLVA